MVNEALKMALPAIRECVRRWRRSEGLFLTEKVVWVPLDNPNLQTS